MNQMLNNEERLFSPTGDKFFEKDILDLFLGLKTAHLSAHTFAHSAALWDDFFNTPSDYYVVKDELNIINDNIVTIRKTCGQIHNIVDFGPGSAGAIEKKTLPIVNTFSFNLKRYYAMDTCYDYLQQADAIVAKNSPKLERILMHNNFFDDVALPISSQSLGLLFGLTLTNMPGIYNKESGIKYLREELSTFRKFLPKGSFFLCSYDVCQNEDKLMRAYDHPKHAAFIKSITSKIKSDLLHNSEFDQDAWFYNPKWDVQNHMFKHVLTSEYAMSFSLNGRSFHIPKGFDIVSYMSVKFPYVIYNQLFKEAGFEEVIAPFKGPNGDINISLLRAV